ncbi:hypothetical protein LC085_07670 [Bacillus tianshenii]|uniref:hypothetical protein n=1 Tax=Sutcliffiella tianshenii TaxID=1463404 RepID=UPI001CD1B1E1|nr:hypothetical protein [Bacillus tianshenii]MCA1319790.1 hypothetical protein [Bacillus tianshenii]
MKAKDCSNLAKEFNGEANWCLIRDAHCHLLVKHERYKFNRRDLVCGYLGALNASLENPAATGRTCGECGRKFDGVGRAKYCGDTCKSIAKKKSNRKSYANRENGEYPTG